MAFNPPLMPDNNELLTEVREMREYLYQMNRRDRLRTIGGTIKGLILLVPTVLLVVSAWYFYKHSDEIIKGIAANAAEQATKYSQGNLDKIINDQMMKLKGGVETEGQQ